MQTIATTKGQIVIPAPLRRKYGIKKGTRIHISEENGRIILQPITPDLVRRLRGSLKGSGILQSLMAERARDLEREDGDWTPSV